MKSLYTFVIVTVIFSSWLNVASAQNVEFPDVNLAGAVREALGLAPNAPITIQGMQTLTVLIANESQITNLTGLEHAIQLRELSLYGNQISDISPLAGLTRLEVLFLSINEINDISPLIGLKQLKTLSLNRNQITLCLHFIIKTVGKSASIRICVYRSIGYYRAMAFLL